MSGPPGAPVVVVGAGPVGCVAALLLAARGVHVEVLERHLEPYPLPRAVHLDDEVHAILSDLELGDQFAAISRPMPGMRLTDAGHRTMAEFRRDAVTGPLGWPQANMFDQPDLERLLLQRLDDHPLVRVRRGERVTALDNRAGHVVVQHGSDTHGTTRRTEASAVLGCDGARSTVREAIGARMRDLHFRERWLVVDLRTPEPLSVWGGVHQICDPRRPTSFMHLTGTRYRWEFKLADDEDHARLTTADALTALLEPWLGRTWPAGTEVVRTAPYTFRALVADRWRAGRVFLLGDAAHQTPPFVGQGLGAGLRDAHNLSWKLAGVLRGDLATEVLDTYASERRTHVTRTVRSAVAVGWALTGGQDRAAQARAALLALLCRIPGASTMMSHTASPPLGRSALVVSRAGRRVVGRPCAAVLRNPDPTREFHVVSATRPSPSEAVRLARLGGRWQHHEWGSAAVLVRPDGIVGAAARGPRAVGRVLAVAEAVVVAPTPRTVQAVAS